MAKRQNKKKRSMPVVRVGEWATPERRRQLGGVMTEVVDRDDNGERNVKRHRARRECVLDDYYQRSGLTDAQYQAALKFREIYVRVNFGYNCKLLCNPFLMEPGQSDPEGKALAHMNCLRLLNEATAELTSAQFAIVRSVCGHDEYAGNKDSKETLRRGLDALAEFWGYK